MYAFIYAPGTTENDLSAWHHERLVEDGATFMDASADTASGW